MVRFNDPACSIGAGIRSVESDKNARKGNKLTGASDSAEPSYRLHKNKWRRASFWDGQDVVLLVFGLP